MSTRSKEPRSPWLLLVVGVVAVVVIAAALIEWNARRSVAAVTRELLRPATPEEQAAIDQGMKEIENSFEVSEEESAAMRAAVFREVSYAPPPPPQRQQIRNEPLGPEERCISGQRFRRLTNGWEEVGSC